MSRFLRFSSAFFATSALGLTIAACSGSSNGGSYGDGGVPFGDPSADGSTSTTQPNEPRDVKSSAEQVNGGCPSKPDKLVGTKKAGDACTTEKECAPSCCDCANDGRSYLAAACIDGTCASRSDACYVTKKALFCPSDPPPEADAGARDASDGGTTVHPDGGKLCVPGTASSCYGADMSWTGSLCCLAPTYRLCASGTASSCYGADLEWTGSQCCVKNTYAQCVAGTASSCYGADLEWTGTECCVKDTYRLCVAGTASSCYGADLEWTGSLCCAVSAYTQCISGTASSCTGANLEWTGQLCCVK